MDALLLDCERLHSRCGATSPRTHLLLPLLPHATLVCTSQVFYLPYLALRPTNTSPIPSATPPPSRLLAVTESRVLPAALAALPIACVLWAAVARPEYGDLPTRVATLANLTSTDILAHSFVVDCAVFWAFQAALVGADARRRDWGRERGGQGGDGSANEDADGGWRRRVAIGAAVVVPFWGGRVRRLAAL